MDLTNIPRTFHPKTAEYTFFSRVYGTFSIKDHILDQKTSFNKFKKNEVTSSIFLDHNDMTLEINYKKKTGKNTNT